MQKSDGDGGHEPDGLNPKTGRIAGLVDKARQGTAAAVEKTRQGTAAAVEKTREQMPALMEKTRQGLAAVAPEAGRRFGISKRPAATRGFREKLRDGWERAARALGRPPGPRWPALSPVARAVERGVHLLDTAIPIPGTKFRIGFDPLLGMLLPAVGDTLGGAVSLSVLFLAVQYRVPSRVIGTMVFNVALDTAVGAIPFVGDAFDFAWKANDRNFELMMTHRGDVSRRASVGYWLSIGLLLIAGLACVAAPTVFIVWLVKTQL